MKKKVLSMAVLASCILSFHGFADARTYNSNNNQQQAMQQSKNAPIVSTRRSTENVRNNADVYKPKVNSNSNQKPQVNSSVNANQKVSANSKIKPNVNPDNKVKGDKKVNPTYKIDGKTVSQKEFDKKYKTDKKGNKISAPNKSENKTVKGVGYEVVNGKTYFQGTQIPDNYQEISIYGESVAHKSQAVAYLKANNASPKLDCSPEQIVNIYWQEAGREGIRPDIAFCQALLETGFFSYRGDVLPKQNNFCGLGTTGSGVKGASFKTPELGARAHIQHLLAYARTSVPSTEIIDPRYKLVHGIRMERGLINNWYGLNGTWAMGGHYCEKILAHYQNMLTMPISKKDERRDTKKAKEKQSMRERVDKIIHDKK
ncbi:MAG: glucosaminidase domain-containing protein [Phascolarctobacterium sp.]|nr:glucosaminidase domain-containing protein [Phascolarctobacterium sp.]